MEEIDRSEGVEGLKIMFKNESDVVWGEFTRSDLENILKRAVINPDGFSVNDLFQLLRSPILIDDGRKSFSLEEWTGKKCLMVSAKELFIAWGDNPEYWTWVSYPYSRFKEVAQLLQVCWLDIKGKLKSTELSPNTTYVAYLIFKLSEDSYGFEHSHQNASVIIGDQRSEEVVHLHRNTMNRDQVQTPSTQNEETDHLAYRREDGWYEVLLGEFFNNMGNEEEVVARSYETERLHWKGGLVVQGIEFRPKKII